ncbi:RNA polymerase sigma factor [Alicyclobacillus sp. SO9]|uniref:RNA polymerase sigma factor n=1 Tax=Alicyclobacillus sp. SO9 TaxID=2665646 RepID=UPI001E5ABA1F|nr:RNA polymerase sigma factor [Alicyclobacillus sp. SO9]
MSSSDISNTNTPMSNSCFRELYDVHYAAVMAFARSAAQTEEDAEEIVQDVFVKVARNYHQFHGKSSVRTWVLAIARNVITDYWRKQSRRAKYRADDVEGEDIAKMSSETAVDPLDYTVKQDESTCIRMFVDKLPQHMRLVVLCRIYQSFSVLETARILGWSQARVRVTYSRALRKLRTVWPGREEIV